jgi:hypothetical protein
MAKVEAGFLDRAPEPHAFEKLVETQRDLEGARGRGRGGTRSRPMRCIAAGDPSAQATGRARHGAGCCRGVP